jgi:hypothetical protein
VDAGAVDQDLDRPALEQRFAAAPRCISVGDIEGRDLGGTAGAGDCGGGRVGPFDAPSLAGSVTT